MWKRYQNLFVTFHSSNWAKYLKKNSSFLYFFYKHWWIWSVANNFFPQQIQIQLILIILVYYKYIYPYYKNCVNANTNLNIICEEYSQIYLNIQIFATQCCAPQENRITLGTSLGQIFPDNPSDFPLFYHTSHCTMNYEH